MNLRAYYQVAVYTVKFYLDAPGRILGNVNTKVQMRGSA